jgi:hypothetical protein
MPREVEKGAVVNDKTIRVFPDYRGLHAVVENLARYAANRLERGNVAAQNRLQILVNDEPRIAEHHGEQPDDPRRPGLVGELNLEPGQIDLSLLVSNRTSSQVCVAPRTAALAVAAGCSRYHGPPRGRLIPECNARQRTA